MQAIKTKYLPATNTKPSRIKAECEAGSITISYDHSLNERGVHRKAMYALLDKLDWNPTATHTGSLNDCYVHVLEFGNNAETSTLPELLKPQA